MYFLCDCIHTYIPRAHKYKHATTCICVKFTDDFQKLFSLFTMWIPGTELRCQGWQQVSLSRVISPAPELL